jgi:hypothetical protein
MSDAPQKAVTFVKMLYDISVKKCNCLIKKGIKDLNKM